jgi:hypothetical protein
VETANKKKAPESSVGRVTSGHAGDHHSYGSFRKTIDGKKAIQALERNEKEENTVPRQHT